MSEMRGLATILSSTGGLDDYAQSSGPEHKPGLPITYWFPRWWGISPWATAYWKASKS
jgi:hypothetical protein